MDGEKLDQLHRKAEACFALAREAADAQTRLLFLDMAQFWAQQARNALKDSEQNHVA
jgi:hypothetical protein